MTRSLVLASALLVGATLAGCESTRVALVEPGDPGYTEQQCRMQMAQGFFAAIERVGNDPQHPEFAAVVNRLGEECRLLEFGVLEQLQAAALDDARTEFNAFKRSQNRGP
ncbi:MAG: hypothetical protein ACT4P1_14620 [Sporichthyaceae bacterium]